VDRGKRDGPLEYDAPENLPDYSDPSDSKDITDVFFGHGKGGAGTGGGGGPGTSHRPGKGAHEGDVEGGVHLQEASNPLHQVSSTYTPHTHPRSYAKWSRWARRADPSRDPLCPPPAPHQHAAPTSAAAATSSSNLTAAAAAAASAATAAAPSSSSSGKSAHPAPSLAVLGHGLRCLLFPRR